MIIFIFCLEFSLVYHPFGSTSLAMFPHQLFNEFLNVFVFRYLHILKKYSY